VGQRAGQRSQPGGFDVESCQVFVRTVQDAHLSVLPFGDVSPAEVALEWQCLY
jgi:hypothetical protein